MEYWARINGKDYPIAYGFTTTDEFSENLDSASITLPHVLGKLNVKPYDDIIIHDYGKDGLPPRKIGEQFVPEGGHFYRHMLIFNPTRERLSMADVQGKKAYNYHLDLISETKGLETVQLPNRTITQPRGTGETEREISLAQADFAYNDGPTFTLPFGVAGVYYDGTVVEKIETQLYATVSTYLFAGDLYGQTADYSRFSVMSYTEKPGNNFVLPDWNISAVSVVSELRNLAGRHIVSQNTYHPKKHWVIVKKGINDNLWDSQFDAVSRFESYLALVNSPNYNPADFPEIKNRDFDLPDDVTSEDSVATISAIAPAVSGSAIYEDYAVFMYVEPLIHQGAETSFNVFGMTDNSHGTIPPTAFSRFMAKWEFRVGNLVMLAKGVLSVYEAVRQAIELYSPYIKVTEDGQTWRWRRKYSIDPLTKNKFMTVIAPENQWNYPNLRDYITKLFYVADCIPVVHDGVITHMDLSQRHPNPFDATQTRLSYDQESMDGGSYCDRLLRNYNNGLSKENVVNCVERIGFKNSGSPTLTLENLTLELSHPVYRINKLYMCYYTKFTKNGSDYMRLCKQDITPLILLNSQRNLLSEDWNTLENVLNEPYTIKDLAKFKYATIGYDLGSDKISGWGMKYNFPKCLFWSATKTVIENILIYVMQHYPRGVRLTEEDLSTYDEDVAFDSLADLNRKTAPYDDSEEYVEILNEEMMAEGKLYTELFSNYTQKLKSLMFIVEYEGFVSGAVMASKDFHDGPIVSRDNASASLSFVESDGINQKEKVNRLGNSTVTCSGRYKTPDEVGELSQVWNDDEHTDEVLFRKTVRYDVDYVTASYFFCRDFVIRNYFTSVFSKHRPFPLASYEESVERQENRTLQILFSPDKCLWQDVSNRLEFDGDFNRLLSFYRQSEYDSAGNIHIEDGIDVSYYKVYPSEVNTYKGQVGAFAVDVQKFISGYSLCFNITMKDNVSGGVFVSDFNHVLSGYVGEAIKETVNLAGGYWNLTVDETVASNLLTGAKQDWFMFPVDPNTGMLYNMVFAVGYRKNDIYAVDGIKGYSRFDMATAQLLPLMDSVIEKSNGDNEYFGDMMTVDGARYPVAGGYPTISLVENGVGWYKAVIDRSKIGKVLHDVGNSFVTPDGVILNGRDRVGEMASSIFRAHETEESEETVDCVFKDGKERINTTLQFEPVSEDSRVMFSEYMFKLSDVMGGKPKNYKRVEVSNRLIIKSGVINTYIYSRGDNSPDSGFAVFMGFPTMSICVPRDVAYDLAGAKFGVDGHFTVMEPDGVTELYSIDVKSAVMSADTNEIDATCDIMIRGRITVRDSLVKFYDIDEVGDYLPGRTEASNYDPQTFSFREAYSYRTYAFVEDFFQYGIELQNATFSYRFFQTEEQYFLGHVQMGDAPSTIPSFYRYYFDLLPSENVDYWAAFANGEFNHKNVRIIADDWVGSRTMAVVETEDEYRDLGAEIGTSFTEGRNLFWSFFPQKMGPNTPFETLSSLEGTVFSSDPDSEDTPKFLIGTNIDITRDDLGRVRMAVTMPFEVVGPGSLRLYYFENGAYHFVYGMNLDQGETGDETCIHPKNGVYYVYISFVDDRSRTVWDLNSGDPDYETVNFANDDATFVGNKCVEK